jgi:hypothetical protein
MKPNGQVDIGRMFTAGKPIDDALARAARDAYLRHKRAGVPIVVWEGGRIVRVPPDEIVVPPEVPSQPVKQAAPRRRAKRGPRKRRTS